MKVGDVVLVHYDMPCINWKLAIIEEIIVGNDGLVRAAHIRTVKDWSFKTASISTARVSSTISHTWVLPNVFLKVILVKPIRHSH